MDSLIEVINFHEWRYYILNEPLIADLEYDLLFKKLEKIEAAHPNEVKPYSPTQRVSVDLSEDMPTIKHLTPMLSLENSYNAEDLNDFQTRLEKLTEQTSLTYCVEPKFDGGTVVLVYENDMLVSAATRGNGQEGEEITLNMKALPSIPLKAEFSKYGITKVELRGEAVIRKIFLGSKKQDRKKDKVYLQS